MATTYDNAAPARIFVKEIDAFSYRDPLNALSNSSANLFGVSLYHGIHFIQRVLRDLPKIAAISKIYCIGHDGTYDVYAVSKDTSLPVIQQISEFETAILDELVAMYPSGKLPRFDIHIVTSDESLKSSTPIFDRANPRIFVSVASNANTLGAFATGRR